MFSSRCSWCSLRPNTPPFPARPVDRPLVRAEAMREGRLGDRELPRAECCDKVRSSKTEDADSADGGDCFQTVLFGTKPCETFDTVGNLCFQIFQEWEKHGKTFADIRHVVFMNIFFPKLELTASRHQRSSLEILSFLRHCKTK